MKLGEIQNYIYKRLNKSDRSFKQEKLALKVKTYTLAGVHFCVAHFIYFALLNSTSFMLFQEVLCRCSIAL